MAAVSVAIRPAERADSAAVRALVTAVLGEYGLPPDPLGTDADLDDIALHYRDGHFWVVDDGGAVVGSCALYPVGDGVVELRKMYLAPSVRGHGWGRRLLEQALAAARADGYVRIQLETATVLKEAIGLYQRYGFERVERAPESCRCDQLWELGL
jgi:GNAT superfamily N-acetyltransferase